MTPLNRFSLGILALVGGPIVSACVTHNDDGSPSRPTATTTAATRVAAVGGSASPDTGRAMSALASAAEVQLGATPTRVTLRELRGSALANQVRALAGTRRIFLVARDLRADVPPGALFQVYLDLPASMAESPGGLHHVGSLNFFDANRAPGAGVVHSFDITRLLTRLAAANALSDVTTLTFTSDGAVSEGSRPTIGRIEIVEQ